MLSNSKNKEEILSIVLNKIGIYSLMNNEPMTKTRLLRVS